MHAGLIQGSTESQLLSMVGRRRRAGLYRFRLLSLWGLSQGLLHLPSCPFPLPPPCSGSCSRPTSAGVFQPVPRPQDPAPVGAHGAPVVRGLARVLPPAGTPCAPGPLASHLLCSLHNFSQPGKPCLCGSLPTSCSLPGMSFIFYEGVPPRRPPTRSSGVKGPARALSLPRVPGLRHVCKPAGMTNLFSPSDGRVCSRHQLCFCKGGQLLFFPLHTLGVLIGPPAN